MLPPHPAAKLVRGYKSRRPLLSRELIAGRSQVTPSYFWVQTAPPHPGAIAEGHYIIEDGTVTLTDVMGKPFPVSNTSASLGPQMTKWLSLGSCCAARHPTSVVTCFFFARLLWIMGAQ